MAEKKKAKTGETYSHNFQAEVAKLLHLMVHSVYSDRDVFLRELISNAADALDKLRYEAIAKPELLAGAPDLAITITPDKAAKTLTVADNGIGMSEQELIDNLGTIAKSGTQAFMEQAKDDKDKGGIHLIGQFGVGFYSSFMVAHKVEVTSRKAGTDEAFAWSSDGTGTFTVASVKPEAAPLRGTSIVLHLKEDALEFLEDWKIEEVVRAYSDHIAHPIRLAAGTETTRQINAASAIWTRAKTDITPDQYKEFFGHITGAYSDPALTLHYKAEGRNEYTVLLFVPGEKPFDLYDPERRGRQKLYVRRVFITSDAELLPPYLRFVRGVIDSEDMPLNISREMLQHNPQVAAIRKAVTNKVLAELKKCFETEPEKAAKIWDAFGPVIKEGLYEDMERRDQLFEIARFNTTKREGVTLKDYIADLKANQTAIYYLTAEDAAKAKASPQLEGFRARGIEVLLLTDAVDSFWVRMALGFDGKPFKSVTQGAADLDLIPLVEEAPKSDADEGATATLIALIKQTLGDQVGDVRKSARLTDSPVCLVASDQGLDRTLEKLLARQGTTDVKVTAPILEINAGHALIKALAETAKKSGASAELGDASGLLLDLARVMDGERVADPAKFAGSVSALMQKAYS
ncbi:molecular chaperone HtpG [Taklimakanibacter albus]|uniref:Molecular chaperone HtpG n=1 Tax=Taklimakanibacter albus TaxID=2800327 RepID=A0ACC5QWY0_9HYPH|nr:molecular chaperone HtpG [Aestuariivirga sp. YIM B02566]MBK1864873.1 molecular chaperone HtpG [Aestuariivirga sp. YIM B02566]